MLTLVARCDTCRKGPELVISQRHAVRPDDLDRGGLVAVVGVVFIGTEWAWDGKRLRCRECAEKDGGAQETPK